VTDGAGKLYIVWYDGRDDYYEIYFKVCDDTVWGEDERVTHGLGGSWNPVIAVSEDGTIHGAGRRPPGHPITLNSRWIPTGMSMWYCGMNATAVTIFIIRNGMWSTPPVSRRPIVPGRMLSSYGLRQILCWLGPVYGLGWEGAEYRSFDIRCCRQACVEVCAECGVDRDGRVTLGRE
jgi:hypothetical protein